MRVRMTGAGEEDLPEPLARKLIGFGLAEAVVVIHEPPAPSVPSLKMRRNELAAIAAERGVVVEEGDAKSTILANIEAATDEDADD